MGQQETATVEGHERVLVQERELGLGLDLDKIFVEVLASLMPLTVLVVYLAQLGRCKASH